MRTLPYTERSLQKKTTKKTNGSFATADDETACVIITNAALELKELFIDANFRYESYALKCHTCIVLAHA